MTTTNFEEFMQVVDWNDLDTNEQKALFDILDIEVPSDLGIFKSQKAANSDDNIILTYTGADAQLVLTPDSKEYFKHWLEEQYTNNEDGSSYLEWKQQVEKND